MRKIVIFTMILTVIFAMVGCTAHSEPDKKATESSSANAVIDTRQAEELTEKTENETVDKSIFAEETTQSSATKISTEKLSEEPIFFSNHNSKYRAKARYSYANRTAQTRNIDS